MLTAATITIRIRVTIGSVIGRVLPPHLWLCCSRCEDRTRVPGMRNRRATTTPIDQGGRLSRVFNPPACRCRPTGSRHDEGVATKSPVIPPRFELGHPD